MLVQEVIHLVIRTIVQPRHLKLPQIPQIHPHLPLLFKRHLVDSQFVCLLVSILGPHRQGSDLVMHYRIPQIHLLFQLIVCVQILQLFLILGPLANLIFLFVCIPYLELNELRYFYH